MVDKGGLKVDERLVKLVQNDIAPGTGVDPEAFWDGFSKLVLENAPRNKALLDKRDDFQQKINAFHTPRGPIMMPEYKKFLSDIGYLLPEGPSFAIETRGVDPEIATIACLLYTSPSPRDQRGSRMPSSA